MKKKLIYMLLLYMSILLCVLSDMIMARTIHLIQNT